MKTPDLLASLNSIQPPSTADFFQQLFQHHATSTLRCWASMWSGSPWVAKKCPEQPLDMYIQSVRIHVHLHVHWHVYLYLNRTYSFVMYIYIYTWICILYIYLYLYLYTFTKIPLSIDHAGPHISYSPPAGCSFPPSARLSFSNKPRGSKPSSCSKSGRLCTDIAPGTMVHHSLAEWETPEHLHGMMQEFFDSGSLLEAPPFWEHVLEMSPNGYIWLHNFPFLAYHCPSAGRWAGPPGLVSYFRNSVRYKSWSRDS